MTPRHFHFYLYTFTPQVPAGRCYSSAGSRLDALLPQLSTIMGAIKLQAAAPPQVRRAAAS